MKRYFTRSNVALVFGFEMLDLFHCDEHLFFHFPVQMPKVQYRSNCKPSTFAYPPALEVPKEKEKEKVSTQMNTCGTLTSLGIHLRIVLKPPSVFIISASLTSLTCFISPSWMLFGGSVWCVVDQFSAL